MAKSSTAKAPETPGFGRTGFRGSWPTELHPHRCGLVADALEPLRLSEHRLVPEHGDPKQDDLLVLMLDDAIRSARRTGAAMERLHGTLTELQAWAAEKLEAVPGKAGA